ncbi:MAG: hypothetical protein APR53_00045 [Methanoculleus sp. SDB]|nr:MAG: hypothetical protein APR53_00045 [Methanoculleus sp. SDB]
MNCSQKFFTILFVAAASIVLLCGAANAVCPCMIPDEAPASGSIPCDAEQIPRGYDTEQQPKYSFQSPSVSPTADPDYVDITPPTITVRKQQETWAPGDRVEYRVTASDESGIAYIELWANGGRVRICIAQGTCDYVTPPLPNEIEFGVIAADRYGNIGREGNVPPDARGFFESSDEQTGGDVCTTCTAASTPQKTDDWRESLFLPCRILSTYKIALGATIHWEAFPDAAPESECTTCNSIQYIKGA